MKTSIKRLPDSKIEILVEISSEDFDHYYQQVILDLGKEIKIKGFRPGHAPSNILKKEIGLILKHWIDLLHPLIQKGGKNYYLLLNHLNLKGFD